MKKINFIFSVFVFLNLLFALSVSAQNYHVGDGDVLRIEVYDNEDLRTIVRVSGEGAIVMPLIGKIEVKNLSTTQISDLLVEKLGSGYLKSPQVNVFIQEYRAQRVTVLGQVENSGSYELRGPTTFLEVVSQAGGLTDDVGDRAFIERTDTENKTHIINIDLDALIEQGDTSQNIPIKGGDTISVKKAGFFYVTGEVRSPSSYKYNKKDKPTVIKAITLAGGFTGRAAKNDVKIFRVIQGKEIIIEDAKMAVEILEDDVVVVPESFF